MEIALYSSEASFYSIIRNTPILSDDETFVLAIDYYENNNNEAAKKLVMHNLRYVYKIVKRKYYKYEHMIMDLVHEGIVGLMIGIKKFNPYKGVKLLSYVTHWIYAHINIFLATNAFIIKRFNRSDKEIEVIKQLKEGSLIIDSSNSIILEKILSTEVSINELDDKGRELELACDTDYEEFIINNITNTELNNMVNDLKLNERELFIYNNITIADKEDSKTYQEVANELSISKQRVYELEKNILKRIKLKLLNIDDNSLLDEEKTFLINNLADIEVILSEKEYIVLHNRILEIKETLNSIASKLNVHKVTIYKIEKKLVNKIKKLYKKAI